MPDESRIEQRIHDATMIVKSLAQGDIAAAPFLSAYADFYYVEALDGHEACSALAAQQRAILAVALEFHRRIQEEVGKLLAVEGYFTAEQLRKAGRILEPEARARALSICNQFDAGHSSRP